MKPILLTLILIPSLLFSQKRNDTKIIVVATDTTNIFNRIAMALIDVGYSFEQKDRELNFIRTTEKAMKTYSASTKINALVKDSTIIFSGLLRLDIKILGEADTFSPVQYKTNSGNINTIIWAEMLRIAKKFGNNITYTK